MRDVFEIAGVIGLWVLGMLATFPGSWPTWVLVTAAVLAAAAVISYGFRAIAERRSGNRQYFKIALLSVFLLVISLGASAIQLEGGAQYLLGVALGLGLVFVSAMLFKNRRRPPSSAA
jgi:ABC-type uncharacterized transport system permease subunit